MTLASERAETLRRIVAWASAPERVRFTIFGVLLVTGLAGAAQTGLFDRDEPRYAQATREMIAAGDWLLPTFNGEPRLHKPVAIYWLMAPFYSLIGDSPLAARMPSILAAAIAGVLVHALANRWWGSRAALWAAIVWATAPLTVVESRMASTDAVLNAMILGMAVCLTRLYGGPEPRTARLFWILAGFSILTKGPIGLLFPAAGVAAARYWAKVRLPLSWLRPKEGIAIVATIVLPWVAAVNHRTHGEFLRFSVGRELLGRTLAPAEGHGGFPGYYFIMLVPMFLPWSIFLAGALRKAWSVRHEDPRISFLLGYAFGPLLLLELISTKLVHYHFPAYAALAILTGVRIAELEATSLRPNLLPDGRFLKIAINAFAIGLMLASVGLACAYPRTTLLPCLIVLFAMGYAVYRGVPAIREGDWKQAIHASTIGWAVTILTMLGWILPANESARLATRVATRLKECSARIPGTVALAEFRDPSVVHALNRPTPVPVVRSREDMRELIDRVGPAIVPLSPNELEKVHSDGELNVRILSEIEAFDWDRGRKRKITLALITADPAHRLARLPGGVMQRHAAESGPIRR